MFRKLLYDCGVSRLNSATVAVIGLLVSGLFFSAPAFSQMNGTPASVTSINFGGHLNSTPGVPPSVTSIGSKGMVPGNQFAPNCCINPLAPVNPNPPLFNRGHHRHSNSFFPAGAAVYVPYPVAGDYEEDDAPAQANPADDDRGGPTIFDRRGSGQPARPYVADYPPPHRGQQGAGAETPAPPTQDPVPDQPQTVLIFKDGHQVEVQNYAVVGNMLYDLTPGHHRKIAIADLDLTATAKQNDDLGINFQLPPSPESNQPEVNK
jgi:hypothetical protein